MKFEQYPLLPAIRQSLSELSFRRPTDIQFKAIPSILKGEDVMAIAPTGTGKTAAFAIPIIQRLAESTRKYRGVRALVLAPTRELALQIHGVFESIARHTDLLCVAVVGGVDQDPQKEALASEADIVVATPGRVFDLLHQEAFSLKAVEILVLDESDRMMALGFMKDVQDIKKRLPKRHQTLFFSATINESIKKQAYSLVRNAIRIQLSPKNMVSRNVTHSVARVGMDDKRFFLERILKQNPGARTMVFVRTQVRAERVQKAMQRVGLDAAVIHGGMEQEQRNDMLESFQSGKVPVLISTDLSARGIDIKGIQYVVNYDMPDVAENYIHRVGRTGRGMDKGYAISFCAPEEEPLLQQVEAYLGGPLEIMPIDRETYEATLDSSEDQRISKQDILKAIAENERELTARKRKKK